MFGCFALSLLKEVFTNLAASTAVTKGVTPLSLGEGTVFKPNGEYANCHFLSASSRPILFRVMSPVFFNTLRYNTLRWVALQLPELKCVATAVSFLSRTSERCMFILFLKESPVSPTYTFLHFEQTVQ